MNVFRFFLLICLIAVNASGIQAMECQKGSNRLFSVVLQGLSSLIQSIYSIIHLAPSPAQVRSSQELCNDEVSFREYRFLQTHQALEALLETSLDKKHAPTIAFCFSGGGMRALVLTLGFLEGAQQIGLFDTAMYMAGLSGSTWALGSCIASGSSISEYRSSLGRVTKAGLQPIVHPAHLHQLSDSAMQWFMADQPLSAINMYGALLSNMLFAHKGTERFSLTLKESHKGFASKNYPMPIYTAVTPFNKQYEWYEFTPFEMGSEFAQAFIPVDAYGMKFKAGKSQGKVIPLSLGYLFGVFGSAFDVTLHDLVRITGKDLMHDIAHFPKPLNALVDDLLYSVLQGPLQDVRFLPSKLRNISYKMAGNTLEHEKWLTLIDAGIAFNLPFPVLLRKQRAVDIIIVYDASAGNQSFETLKGVQDYAITHNMKFPDIDYAAMGKELVYVFKDEHDSHCPVVIYFPMKKNEQYDATFDPTTASYCSTFNFTYTQKHINQLAGLSRHTLVEYADLVKQVIQKVVDDKKNEAAHV